MPRRGLSAERTLDAAIHCTLAGWLTSLVMAGLARKAIVEGF